jgi:hypothetical protein
MAQPPIIYSHFRRNVELKKVTGKHILKSTLTPKLARKQFEELKATAQTSNSSPPELGSTSSGIPTSLASQVCNLLLTLNVSPALVYTPATGSRHTL